MPDVRDRYASKADFLARSAQYWNPAKTRFWQEAGIDLVIERREGYLIHDMDGRRLIDLHLNGGTYNLGHCHPGLVRALAEGAAHVDMGNHHFPSLYRTALAEELHKASPPALRYTIFASGGGEAIDIAIKTARHATRRKRIVSIVKGYHGHTGLAVCTGDERFSRLFLSDRPDEFVHVPFNDLAAMEEALAGEDVAAVILETIPATYGFPMPAPGYLPAVKALCERHGSLYIADEVQTGLMRTGEMWGIVKYGVVPDLLVTAKGIGGGLYTMGCVLVAEHAAGWLHQDGFGHISTGGGAELGCIVALKVLELTQAPEVRANVQARTAQFAEGLAALKEQHGGFFAGIRQNGLVMGLEFDHPEGAKHVMRALYANGVWAIFSTLDPRVLQFKPGLLVDAALADEILLRLDRALGTAAAASRSSAGRPG